MALEVRKMTPEWEQPLIEFFSSLDDATQELFHPHPFTPAQARELARYKGDDSYYLLVDDARIVAYGMLRGWDEGYEVPSLGIAVHPQWRGKKYGELLMHFLHAAARSRGAKKIRLKVYTRNTAAVQLYARLGYEFGQEIAGGQQVGILKL